MKCTPEEKQRIMLEHQEWVAILARRRSRSPVEADDLVQEGMIALSAAIDAFDSSLSSLMTYSRYGIEDAMRAAEAKERASRRVAAARVGRKEDAPGGDSVVVADLVDRLPRNERLVVREYYWNGRTAAEIGDTLGLTGSRVGAIKSSAIVRLRRMVSASDRRSVEASLRNIHATRARS